MILRCIKIILVIKGTTSNEGKNLIIPSKCIVLTRSENPYKFSDFPGNGKTPGGRHPVPIVEICIFYVTVENGVMQYIYCSLVQFFSTLRRLSPSL